MKKKVKPKSFLELIQDTYTNIIENHKQLIKYLIVIIILVSLYYLIDSLTNYDYIHFLRKELFFSLYLIGFNLFCKIFHNLFGIWWVHATKERLTREFVKTKLPRKIKPVGYTGVGKDSTFNAITKIFRESLIENIDDEIEFIEKICFPYDFQKLNTALDENKKAFMVNSKQKFYLAFITLMANNNCFIKKYYEKKFNAEKHLEEFNKVYRDPYSNDVNKMKYIFDDGIKPKHYLSLVIKYCMSYIRKNHMNSYVMANQPMLETKDKGAKKLSTKYLHIQEENCEYPFPIDGRVILHQTEEDAFNPNVGVKKGQTPMKTGLRNFKAFFRHLLGEESVWINIGQNSSRTNKQTRELDHAFITILDQNKVFGGEKRRYFINKFQTWSEFWANISPTHRGREKHKRRLSKLIEKEIRLEYTGYMYVDLKVSRSDNPGQGGELTIKNILKRDKKIYETYLTRICLKIRDCYFGYNQYYLERISEYLAKKSNTNFNDVEEWDKDLNIKAKDISQLGISVLNDMTGINEEYLKKYNNRIKNIGLKAISNFYGSTKTIYTKIPIEDLMKNYLSNLKKGEC